MSDPTTLDYVVAVFVALGALATTGLLVTALLVTPHLRRRLTTTTYVVDELDEMLQKSASDPQQSTHHTRIISAPALLWDVRTGKHEDVFDRVVFEFAHDLPSYKIVPLSSEGLSSRQVRGQWGLSVVMNPCLARYSYGSNNGQLAPRYTKGFLDSPTIVAHGLTRERDAECEWTIGARSPTRYRSFELDNPLRLVIDFHRKSR